jgi:hypothetical protein
MDFARTFSERALYVGCMFKFPKQVEGAELVNLAPEVDEIDLDLPKGSQASEQPRIRGLNLMSPVSSERHTRQSTEHQRGHVSRPYWMAG